MEENEDKKPEVNEPEAPEAEPEKPVENGSEAPKEKGGKLDAIKGKAKAVKDKAKEKAKVVKQKTGEFMGVKRNRIIVLACSGAAIVALVVGLSVGLTQCHGGDNTSGSGAGESSSEHTHEYGTAWKSDATQHWHECSCGDKKDAAAHSFGDERVVITPAKESTPGKKAFECSVCKFTKDEVAYTPYITSEAAFTSALEFKGEKFTIHYVEDGDWSNVAKNGDVLYNTSSFSEQNNRYYTKVTEGSDTKYYEYFQDKTGKWLKSEDPQETYDSYANFEVNAGLFDSMLTYAGMTFDAAKGCYTASYTDSRSNSVSAELYFDNGRLVKAVSTSTTVTGKSSTATYTFSDSAVSLSLPEAEAHSHAFASDWSKDATDHWKECACGEKDAVGSHRFGDEREVITPASSSEDGTKAYKCSICGYAKDPVSYNPYVNDSNFANALVYNGDKFTVTFQPSGGSKETITRNGNVIHWKGADGTEEYYTKVAEGSETKYYKYAKDSSGAWTKQVTDDAYWDSYASYEVNGDYFDSKLSFTNVNFDTAKGGYTMNYQNSYGTTVNAELYFDKGRLVKAIKSYDTTVETYTFSDEAEETSAPANAHMHILPTSGKLDLNSSVPQFVATCSDCQKEGSRDFNSSTDTVTSVLYGYYPQSHVKDSATITSLANATLDSATGWYKLGSDYYVKATSAAAVPSGLEFNDLTPIASRTEYWYKCDPIEWKVLTSSNGTYSLVSTLLLESHNFNGSSWSGKDGTPEHYANNYEYSALRSWLTGEFFNKAFAKSGSTKIQNVTVDNSSSTFNYNGTNSDLACNNTSDKIYLLSQKECSAGTGSSLPVQEDRWCEASEYLRASGAGNVVADSNCATYWTRSPYALGASHVDGDYANVVDDNGGSACCAVTDVNCVRPAITVRVS